MPLYKSIAIVGVGLIGGSIGLAVRKRGLADEVIGVGRGSFEQNNAEGGWGRVPPSPQLRDAGGSLRSTPATQEAQAEFETAAKQSAAKLEEARALGAVTEIATDIAGKNVAQADLVIVCTPVAEIANHVLQIANSASERTIITDAGSTKGKIVADVEAKLPPGKRFIGSHPLAGSEKKGVKFAAAELFQDRVVILTPTARTEPEVALAVEEFWSAIGAVVLRMSPEVHDQKLAATSHLPHLVAAAVAKNTARADLPLTAGGWRDLTRIAGGDPELWTQILLENRPHVLNSLAEFGKTVAEFQLALEQGDAARLRQLLTEGKLLRDALGN
ncbi:MAG TPA: prephenate dehydrogenase [Pirellulales bacterium]|jgi:prephenate dehydrogenase